MWKALKTYHGVLYSLSISCYCFCFDGRRIFSKQTVKIKELNNMAEGECIIEITVSEESLVPFHSILPAMQKTQVQSLGQEDPLAGEGNGYPL